MLSPKPIDQPSRYASPKEVKLAIDELRAVLSGPNDVSTDPDALKTYGFSENSYHPASSHTVIVHSIYIFDMIFSSVVSRFGQNAPRMSSISSIYPESTGCPSRLTAAQPVLRGTRPE
ncbi:hypothetical protein DXG01_013233 [Tephrocybe rancida]|nr:hypothetical protein DXG01_013233 [Tephrocybe rancida]